MFRIGTLPKSMAETTPEPESMHPETTALKSSRPRGSGDLEQISTAHTYSGSGLEDDIRTLIAAGFVFPDITLPIS
jgi:hypothetical protein